MDIVNFTLIFKFHKKILNISIKVSQYSNNYLSSKLFEQPSSSHLWSDFESFSVGIVAQVGNVKKIIQNI